MSDSEKIRKQYKEAQVAMIQVLLAERNRIDTELSNLGYVDIAKPKFVKKTRRLPTSRLKFSMDVRLKQMAQHFIRAHKDPETDPKTVDNPELKAVVLKLLSEGSTGYSKRTYMSGLASLNKKKVQTVGPSETAGSKTPDKE